MEVGLAEAAKEQVARVVVAVVVKEVEIIREFHFWRKSIIVVLG